MVDPKNIIEQDGYLVDASTGERVVFYECDPAKNTACDHSMCRESGESQETEGNLGLCAKTLDPTYKREGGRSWYSVKKRPPDGEGEPYWGREYCD